MLSSLLACACADDYGTLQIDNGTVVEGWIDKDSVAKVIVTHNFVAEDEVKIAIDSMSIGNCKVMVSDGTNSEWLEYVTDSTIFPYHYFKGKTLKGSTGKDYSLTIYRDDKVITSTTTVCKDVPVKMVTCSNIGKINQSIAAYFTDLDYKNSYYVLMAKKKNEESKFYPVMFSCIDGSTSSSPLFRVVVSQSFRNITHSYKFKLYSGDTISIKAVKVNYDVYQYWNTFSDHIMNKSSPMTPSYTNIIPNVNGAFGIWGGYGSKPVDFIVKDTIYTKF